jgi:acetyl-CoA acetyltransferase
MDILRDNIAAVGIGETEYSIKPGRDAKELISEAIYKALDDAQLTTNDIDGIVTEGSWVPHILDHYDMAYNMGIQPRFCGTIGSSGNGNVAVFHMAAMAIATGRANTVLTYYTNAYRSLHHRGQERHLTEGAKDTFEVPYGGSVDPNIDFGMIARRYMYEYGYTGEQLSKALGTIAVDHRQKALLNGKGVLKEPLTLEDYMKSPVVADPLRLEDYCRWNDGACAWIVTSADRAKDFPHVPVYVTGLGYASHPEAQGDYFVQGTDTYYHKPQMAVALNSALDMAGISLKELDFAQVYDAYTMMLLVFLENLGFCQKGEGPAFIESGAMALDGSMPINTHGGHLSHSYINMASHVVEAIKQLRGEAGPGQIKDAKFGMFEGGSTSFEYVTILRRD